MMPCGACALARQLVLNLLLTLDLVGNVILLGLPRETISRRTARARAAGSRAAARFCQVLTWGGIAFFGQPKGRDHCDWALQGGDAIAAELWHWSPPEIVQPHADAQPQPTTFEHPA